MTATLSAHSMQQASPAAIDEIRSQLAGAEPQALIFFCSPNHDGLLISKALREQFPEAENIGCSTCGEWSDQQMGKGGVAVLAMGARSIKRCASALAHFDKGVEAGIAGASRNLSAALGADIRELDSSRYAGFMLVESARGREEAVNESLGDVAPLLSFVGGSAGDNFAFKQTHVYRNGEVSLDGVALLLMEMTGPFVVVKTCNFEPGSQELVVTKARPEKRQVLEFNGRPAAEAYAEAVGVAPEQLGMGVFMTNPVGLVIDGKPWLRSVAGVTEEGCLSFACVVSEGMRLNLMRPRDLVADTRDALVEAHKQLGTAPAGGLLCNCGYRMLEMEARKLEEPYHGLFKGFPNIGFHSHGESWLGHINQTLTGLLFA